MKNILIVLLLCLTLASKAHAQSPSNPIKGSFVRATIPYTSLTGVYVVILTNTKKLVGCTFTNATNAAVDWSDITNNPISENQPSLSKEYYDFASNGRYVDTSIKIKYTVGAPTVGNIYINCYY